MVTNPNLQKEGPSPFGKALHLCRTLGQGAAEAVEALPAEDRRNLVFRLAGECLRLHVEPASVFAAAMPAKMRHVAYATAAIRSAMAKGGLGLRDIVSLGLMEPKVMVGGKTWLVPHLGREAIAKAAKALREQGNPEAARPLELHLARGEEAAILAEARRAAKEASASLAEEGTAAPPTEKAEKKPKKK